MKRETVRFKNEAGHELRGKIQWPIGQKPRHFALFAHCFTCSKDLKAVANLSLALTQAGIAVLRFDFTGLGQSEGDFADTNFSSNLDDLMAAAQFLAHEHRPPSLLIGHSLGGAAVLHAAEMIEEVKAVATIGAPSQANHVQHLLQGDIEKIEEDGSAKVSIGGKPFTIKKQFLDDLKRYNLKEKLQDWRNRSLLVLHSPQDQTVGIENAREIYEAAHHPKSFVSLDGADHLLGKEEDSRYVGAVIAAWAKRYLPAEDFAPAELDTDKQVVVQLDEAPFLTRIRAGAHQLLADEPKSVGGNDEGPSPYQLVSAALGACTAMTLRMYANRKEWPLEKVAVHLSYDGKYSEDLAHCEEEERRIGKFTRWVEIEGDLDEKQRERLLEIANKCPVHRSLTHGVTIETRWRE